MGVVKDLLRRRHAVGAETPLGHRLSNLAEQVRHFEFAEGERRPLLAGNIAKSVAGIQRLAQHAEDRG